MTTSELSSGLTTTSGDGLHVRADADGRDVADASVRRWIGVIWGLLLANATPWIGGSLLPIP